MTGAVSGDAGLVPKLRFPEFEGDWVEKRLGDVAAVERGKFSVRPRNDPAYFGGSIPFAQTGDIVSASRYLVRYSQTLNDLGVSVSRVFPKNTIMITIAANIGDLAITSFPVAVPDSVVGIVANKNTSVEFLYSQMSNKRDELLSYATQNAQANINLQILVPLELALPTLPEQQKIADFLAAVDARLGGLRQKRELLAAYKRGVMQQIFTQTLRFKQDDGSAFPDWEEKRLGDIVNRASEKFDPTSSSEKPVVVELENILPESGQITGAEPHQDQMSLLTRFRRGDVLFGKLRPYLKKFANPDFDGACSSEIWVLRSVEVLHGFLFQFIQTPTFMSAANQSSGSKMPRADWSILSEMTFLLPHSDEQKKIADFLTALDAKITTVAAKITQTEAFKKGLLQQMFV